MEQFAITYQDCYLTVVIALSDQKKSVQEIWLPKCRNLPFSYAYCYS